MSIVSETIGTVQHCAALCHDTPQQGISNHIKSCHIMSYMSLFSHLFCRLSEMTPLEIWTGLKKLSPPLLTEHSSCILIRSLFLLDAGRFVGNIPFYKNHENRWWFVIMIVATNQYSRSLYSVIVILYCTNYVASTHFSLLFPTTSRDSSPENGTNLFPLMTGFRRARSRVSTLREMSGGRRIRARWCLWEWGMRRWIGGWERKQEKGVGKRWWERETRSGRVSRRVRLWRREGEV